MRIPPGLSEAQKIKFGAAIRARERKLELKRREEEAKNEKGLNRRKAMRGLSTHTSRGNFIRFAEKFPSRHVVKKLVWLLEQPDLKPSHRVAAAAIVLRWSENGGDEQIYRRGAAKIRSALSGFEEADDYEPAYQRARRA